MTQMSTSNNSANLRSEYYIKELLDTLGRLKVVADLATPSINVPMGEGKLAKWLRYDEFNCADPTLFELQEGVVPSDSSLTTRNITATVKQYGTFVTGTDLLLYTAIDPVQESAARRLGEHGGQLVERLAINELASGLPIQYANGKASLATTGVGDVMTSKEILKAVINLKKNSVPKHESGSYVAIVHPVALGDLLNDTNVGSVVDINKYTGENVKNILNGEVGPKVFGCKILESDMLNSTTSGTLASASVYSNFVIGKQCFGSVSLGAKNVKMYTKDQASGGTSNPLEQFYTIGYKIMGLVFKYLGGSSNGTSDRGYTVKAGTNY